MKKPRYVDPKKVNPKLCKTRVQNLEIDNKFARKSFCQFSLPLFLLGVVLFHANLTCGNEEYGHENITSRITMESNTSLIINNPSHHHDSRSNQQGSICETCGLEELISIILDYDSFRCRVKPLEHGTEIVPELQQNGRIHLTYPNLDDFKYISRQEKSGSTRQLVNITHRLEPDGTPYNYASSSKGAKVVAHNKEAKGANNILGEDHDKYLRNPCSVGGKFFIVELSDETLVDAVKIANFEHHSSNFKDFELSGSLVYPTETWTALGSFVAANSKHVQCFKLPQPKWARYLKVKLTSHYGSEFYCTLSVVEVYGVDAIEQMLEDLIVTSAESSSNSTSIPSIPEPVSNMSEIDDVGRNLVGTVKTGVGKVDEGQMNGSDFPRRPFVTSSVSEPMPKTRQHPNSRLHADAALKVVLQKVRSVELNLSVLEEYIKELHKRRGDVLPELEKELSKFHALLAKSKLEITNLMEWKEVTEKGILELEAWRVVVSTQMDLLVKQNSMLRLEVEKVLHDQASLERKELAILTLSLFFACIAILKILLSRVVFPPCRGWTLIFIFCCITMLLPVLYG